MIFLISLICCFMDLPNLFPNWLKCTAINFLSHIMAASSPTHMFSGFRTPVLHTTIFPSNWLLFHIDLSPLVQTTLNPFPHAAKLQQTILKTFRQIYWKSLEVRGIFINPFPHKTILQQMTLNVFCQNIENLHNKMDNLWQKVENIVFFVPFLLLSLCFQKAVCCRGVRKRLYERKGLNRIENIVSKGAKCFLWAISTFCHVFIIPLLQFEVSEEWEKGVRKTWVYLREHIENI